jgi:glycosyltransferase involved in cell wall biosynthesis
MFDSGFNKEIKWDLDLLDGYKYKLLANHSFAPIRFVSFFSLINSGVINEISKEKCDYLIVHGWSYLTHIIAIFTAKIKRIPVFIRSESPLNQEILKPKWKLFIKKIFFNFLFRGINGFLAIGSANLDFYKLYGVNPSKIHFMPYSVDNNRITSGYKEALRERNSLRSTLGIPEDKVIILFCGKLIDKKRPLDLLMAYKKSGCSNTALVIIGEGYLRKKLESHSSKNNLKNVFFLGFKNQLELPKYYALADIFVLPSGIGETWGLVVNEAMCCSLPIIVSDLVGCATDLVRHGENGFIYPAGDVDELSKCLRELINNPGLRLKMGRSSSLIIESWNYQSGVRNLVKALVEQK